MIYKYTRQSALSYSRQRRHLRASFSRTVTEADQFLLPSPTTGTPMEWSHKISTQFCSVLFFCDYVRFICEYMRSIYPHHSGLFFWRILKTLTSIWPQQNTTKPDRYEYFLICTKLSMIQNHSWLIFEIIIFCYAKMKLTVRTVRARLLNTIQ